jgi:hypothetical protein
MNSRDSILELNTGNVHTREASNYLKKVPFAQESDCFP